MKGTLDPKIMKNYKQGDFGDGEFRKSGKGGDIQPIMGRADENALTKKESAPRGPGVDGSFWAKHGDKTLIKNYG